MCKSIFLLCWKVKQKQGCWRHTHWSEIPFLRHRFSNILIQEDRFFVMVNCQIDMEPCINIIRVNISLAGDSALVKLSPRVSLSFVWYASVKVFQGQFLNVANETSNALYSYSIIYWYTIRIYCRSQLSLFQSTRGEIVSLSLRDWIRYDLKKEFTSCFNMKFLYLLLFRFSYALVFI